jgi:hypothetical protein
MLPLAVELPPSLAAGDAFAPASRFAQVVGSCRQAADPTIARLPPVLD